MRLLLDTHILVWTLTEVGRLTAAARQAIQNDDNALFVSAVSAYEIDYKREFSPDLARLPFDLEDARAALKFDWLHLDRRQATRAARLPRLHRDPWDRLLIAQAITEDLVLVTADGDLSRYGTPVLW